MKYKHPFLWRGRVEAKVSVVNDTHVVVRLEPIGCLMYGIEKVHRVWYENNSDARLGAASVNGKECRLFLVPEGGDMMAAKKKPAKKAKKATKAAAKKPTKKGGRKRPSYSGL